MTLNTTAAAGSTANNLILEDIEKSNKIGEVAWISLAKDKYVNQLLEYRRDMF